MIEKTTARMAQPFQDALQHQDPWIQTKDASSDFALGIMIPMVLISFVVDMAMCLIHIIHNSTQNFSPSHLGSLTMKKLKY